MPSMAYMVLTCISLFISINGSMATFVLELFSDQVGPDKVGPRAEVGLGIGLGPLPTSFFLPLSKSYRR